jgi:hypothetical protein
MLAGQVIKDRCVQPSSRRHRWPTTGRNLDREIGRSSCLSPVRGRYLAGPGPRCGGGDFWMFSQGSFISQMQCDRDGTDEYSTTVPGEPGKKAKVCVVRQLSEVRQDGGKSVSQHQGRICPPAFSWHCRWFGSRSWPYWG